LNTQLFICTTSNEHDETDSNSDTCSLPTIITVKDSHLGKNVPPGYQWKDWDSDDLIRIPTKKTHPIKQQIVKPQPRLNITITQTENYIQKTTTWLTKNEKYIQDNENTQHWGLPAGTRPPIQQQLPYNEPTSELKKLYPETTSKHFRLQRTKEAEVTSFKNQLPPNYHPNYDSNLTYRIKDKFNQWKIRPTNNHNHTNGFNLTTQRYLVDHAFIQGYATSLQPATIEAIPYDAYKDPNIYSNLHAKLDYYIYTSELLQDKLNRIEEENAELHEKLRVAEIKNIDYEHQLKEHVKNTNPDLLQDIQQLLTSSRNVIENYKTEQHLHDDLNKSDYRFRLRQLKKEFSQLQQKRYDNDNLSPMENDIIIRDIKLVEDEMTKLKIDRRSSNQTKWDYRRNASGHIGIVNTIQNKYPLLD